MILALRLIHAFVLLYCVVVDARLMRDVQKLWLAHRMVVAESRLHWELALLGASVLVQMVIAWLSWRQFERCPTQLSTALFIIWLLLFYYHPWFSRGPLSFSYDDPPALVEIALRDLKYLSWILGQAIFPALSFLARMRRVS